MIKYDGCGEYDLRNQIQENLSKLTQIRVLYRKKMKNYFKNYLIKSEDDKKEFLKELISQIATIDENKKRLKEIQEQVINGETLKEFTNDIYTTDLIAGKQAKISYSGELYKNGSKKVEIMYGFDETWENTTVKNMQKTNSGFTVDIEIENYNTFNFCFANEGNDWDNNNNCNYIYTIISTEDDILKKNIDKYNSEYSNIITNLIKDTNDEESIMLECLETKKVAEIDVAEETEIAETNDTLLISETLDKVILPYTAEEVKEILEDENNEFETAQQVIDRKFTRPFSDYRWQRTSRFNETMKLAREREHYGLSDAVTLSFEMMKTRYLHPAIISACRNLDELDVYLDCLEKDELDEFKIFKIKYELHPLVVKQENGLYMKTSIFERIKNFFKRLFSKNISEEMEE